MFDDSRSRRVIVMSHCLLNQNSIADGTADFPSQFKEIIELCMEKEIGIIQLPCPELQCLGLDRQDCKGAQRPLLNENSRIRELISNEAHIKTLQNKAEEIVSQIIEYKKFGFDVIGVIGVNRSPSCGVETTSIHGEERSGKGIFMEVLSNALLTHGVPLRMIGSKTGEKDQSVEKIRQFLNN